MASRFNLTAMARRLLNMEVNTILCDADAITGEPMPAVPHALLDIATSYADKLTKLGVDLARYFAKDVVDPSAVAAAWVDSPAWVGAGLTVSADTFLRLRWAAVHAHDSPEAAKHMQDGDGVLLERIINNADAIKEIFKRFDSSMTQFIRKTREELVAITIHPNSYVVAPDDLTLLQKIWDIGTDEIVAQTIVYVTGDVTTRVQKSLAKADSAPIFTIHRQSIDVSVNCWKALLDAVGEIAGTAVSVLLGVKK